MVSFLNIFKIFSNAIKGIIDFFFKWNYKIAIHAPNENNWKLNTLEVFSIAAMFAQTQNSYLALLVDIVKARLTKADNGSLDEPFSERRSIGIIIVGITCTFAFLSIESRPLIKTVINITIMCK